MRFLIFTKPMGDIRRFRNCTFSVCSFSLFFEKSLKFVCLKLYETCANCAQKGLYRKLSEKRSRSRA